MAYVLNMVGHTHMARLHETDIPLIVSRMGWEMQLLFTKTEHANFNVMCKFHF